MNIILKGKQELFNEDISNYYITVENARDDCKKYLKQHGKIKLGIANKSYYLISRRCEVKIKSTWYIEGFDRIRVGVESESGRFDEVDFNELTPDVVLFQDFMNAFYDAVANKEADK